MKKIGKIYRTPRCVALLLCALGVLICTGHPVFSAKPLRLFFEKVIVVEEKAPSEQSHVVQKGEWLFKILTDKGYSPTEIQSLMPTIQILNPHIPDIHALQPGQVLHLPEFSPDLPTLRSAAVLPSYQSVSHVVRPGETVTTILSEHGLSREQIAKYREIFLELNPNVADADSLRAGQQVSIPVPKGARISSMALIRPMAIPPSPKLEEEIVYPTNDTEPDSPVEEARKETPPDSKPLDSKDSRTQVTGFPFIRTVLEQMRFSFAAGEEAMYPVPGSGWLHVRTMETPVLETPWGGRIIFCPAPKNAEWVKNANALGMAVCDISPHWDLDEVLHSIAAKFPEQFRIWDPTRDLVLSRNGVSLTISTPYILLASRGGRKEINVLWMRQTPQEQPLPQGLPEVLGRAQVRLIELDAYNRISHLPGRTKDMAQPPTASHMELIRAIQPDDPGQFFGSTLPDNMDALLSLLRGKDMLHQGTVQASWSDGKRKRIAIQVPAWMVTPSANQVALLDKQFSDAYLVSLLANEGYDCFILPN